MSVLNQPEIAKRINRIIRNRQHDLHPYFNFDDGPPSHLYQCPCGLPQLSYEEVQNLSRRENRRSHSVAFLNDVCPVLASEVDIYGKIGEGSKY